MEVLIVSKTRMANGACVGGLVLADNTPVRLLRPGGWNQPSDTKFNVGEIWDIDFVPRAATTNPHTEDVIVRAKEFVKERKSLSSFFKKNDLINWKGPIDDIFDGHLSWTNSGSGHVEANGELNYSVGFWVSDEDLTRHDYYNSVRYRYPKANAYRSIKYVGHQEPVDTIPAGTVLRVSLSRNFAENPGCWLQLSGWY